MRVWQKTKVKPKYEKIQNEHIHEKDKIVLIEDKFRETRLA